MPLDTGLCSENAERRLECALVERYARRWPESRTICDSSRGTPAFSSVMARGVSLRIDDSTDTVESPLNGRSPVSIS